MAVGEQVDGVRQQVMLVVDARQTLLMMRMVTRWFRERNARNETSCANSSMVQPTAIGFERTAFARKFSATAKLALMIDERL